ncbi:hypothetical protein [Mycobacteroides abscessus]|uniref:hypothetical protein n=1 Tax=Mycobacteroides abscessus TaxID=36809 RepID=UPI0018965697
MTDPAVEAARRTSEAFCQGRIPPAPYSNTHYPGVDEIAEFAAREALKPIREHIEKIPAGLDAVALYDELDFIYRRLLGGHCEECRDD